MEAAARSEVFTTSSWLWRLSRAVARGGQGALARAFQRLPDDGQGRVRSALASLPGGIGIVTARRLVPTMAALAGEPNFLTAEAVATAVVIDGKVAVTTRSALMTRVAREAAVGVEVVELTA